MKGQKQKEVPPLPPSDTFPTTKLMLPPDVQQLGRTDPAFPFKTAVNAKDVYIPDREGLHFLTD